MKRKSNFLIACFLAIFIALGSVAFAADTDRRIDDQEQMIGATPSGGLVDTLNRLMLGYHDDNGRPKNIGGSSVASASSISVPDNENYFIVTGTTTITAIASTTSGATAIDTGTIVTIKFSGALTLTHNATSFIMPGGTDYSVEANGIVAFQHLGSGNWQVISSKSSSGTGKGGRVALVIKPNATYPTYQIDVDAESFTVDDGTNVYDVAVNITIDITASGADGLDTGSEANAIYYVHVIYNGTTVAGLLSLSSTSPTMPSGYTYSGVSGFIRNTGDIVDFKQYGNLYDYVAWNSIVSGLTSTAPIAQSVAAGVGTDIALSVFVATVGGGADCVFSTSADATSIVGNVTGGTTNPIDTATPHVGIFVPLNGGENIYYDASAGTHTLYVKTILLDI